VVLGKKLEKIDRDSELSAIEKFAAERGITRVPALDLSDEERHAIWPRSKIRTSRGGGRSRGRMRRR